MSTENPEQPIEETNEAAAPVEDVTEAPASEETSAAASLDIGSEAMASATEVDPDYVPVVRGKVDKFNVAMGTGRRKTSVARARIKAGTGNITVNNRTLEDFFPIERDRAQILAVLKKTDKFGKVDVWIRVSGGGTTGQTGAVVLGVARALHVLDPSLHHVLAENGFLTRDSRMVERKKYGFKKARRSFQFSKR